MSRRAAPTPWRGSRVSQRLRPFVSLLAKPALLSTEQRLSFNGGFDAPGPALVASEFSHTLVD